jgi:hypothetical protein
VLAGLGYPTATAWPLSLLLKRGPSGDHSLEKPAVPCNGTSGDLIQDHPRENRQYLYVPRGIIREGKTARATTTWLQPPLRKTKVCTARHGMAWHGSARRGAKSHSTLGTARHGTAYGDCSARHGINAYRLPQLAVAFACLAGKIGGHRPGSPGRSPVGPPLQQTLASA